MHICECSRVRVSTSIILVHAKGDVAHAGKLTPACKDFVKWVERHSASAYTEGLWAYSLVWACSISVEDLWKSSNRIVNRQGCRLFFSCVHQNDYDLNYPLK